MSGFIGELDVRFLPDGKNVKLLAPFAYQDSLGRTWTVPAGFITDGASIPKALWSSIGSPFTGKYRRAAVIHDFLYQRQPLIREECDRILLEAMMKDETEKLLVDAVYEGVRLGGWKAWVDDKVSHL